VINVTCFFKLRYLGSMLLACLLIFMYPWPFLLFGIIKIKEPFILVTFREPSGIRNDMYHLGFLFGIYRGEPEDIHILRSNCTGLQDYYVISDGNRPVHKRNGISATIRCHKHISGFFID